MCLLAQVEWLLGLVKVLVDAPKRAFRPINQLYFIGPEPGMHTSRGPCGVHYSLCTGWLTDQCCSNTPFATGFNVRTPSTTSLQKVIPGASSTPGTG